MHERGHVLGLYHEQMRSDRDEYLTINYDNINETKHNQFDKLNAGAENNYSKPYDYYSIMHYGAHVSTSNRMTTIVFQHICIAEYYYICTNKQG